MILLHLIYKGLVTAVNYCLSICITASQITPKFSSLKPQAFIISQFLEVGILRAVSLGGYASGSLMRLQSGFHLGWRNCFPAHSQAVGRSC